MKSDFSQILNKYLTSYLPSLRNVSQHTISSYCDTFRILLSYCRDQCGMNIEKIQLKNLNDDVIIAFLKWLKAERNNSVSTSNQRLAAIHSFFRYAQSESPENIVACQKVLIIPSKRKPHPLVNYMIASDIKLLLSMPNTRKNSERRDMVLLSTMYDTGARVQEIIDLKVRDVRLSNPARVVLTGKGMKSREIPLLDATAKLLARYMEEHSLNSNGALMNTLFVNHKGQAFTRNGISYILDKYAEAARKESSTIPEKISPHVLRHSKAMHLLQAGVSIIYIKDLLGHVDIKTTQVYASADLEMKKQALEKPKLSLTPNLPSWESDLTLINWLKEYSRLK